MDIERDHLTRRSSEYPKLVELVYRIRNMARDLSKEVSTSNLSLIDEIAGRTKELEEALYQFRIDLERDGLFGSIHSYKNQARNFCMKLSDIKFFLEHEEDRRAQNARKELSEIYQAIERSHAGIIHDLSLGRSESGQLAGTAPKLES